jgi:hypothetical protein
MEQLFSFGILAVFLVACFTLVLVPMFALLNERFTVRSWLLFTAALCVVLPLVIVYRQTKKQVDDSSPRRATLIVPDPSP